MISLSKGYKRDAGNDIILDQEILFEPHKVQIVNLGKLPHPLPPTVCGIIAPRSSAAQKGLFIANCPIDSDYCGDVHAIVYNAGRDYIRYKAGEAFCQLVIYKVVYDESVKERKNGVRGDGAFGSTSK